MSSDTYVLASRFLAHSDRISHAKPDALITSSARVRKSLTEHAKVLERLRARLEYGTSGLDQNNELANECQKSIDLVDSTFLSTLDMVVSTTAPLEAAVQTGQYAASKSCTVTVSTFEDLQDYPTMDGLAQYYETRKNANQADLAKLTKLERYRSQRTVMDFYEKFRRAIFTEAHDEADEEMPDIEALIAGNQDEDEEMVVERAGVSYKCPVSRTWLENPVTSKVCGHSFSYAAILDVFKNKLGHKYNTDPIKCPVGACSKSFYLDDLQRAPDLAVRAQTQRRRELHQTQRAHSELDVL